ncbi:ATP-dependent helicase [Pseudoxanthomonas composti]|uniref:ATP-dependent helicase n=1 Tax=Pseudoxanthomonas composti TaxID=2137479 RepID=A0A4Q1JR38_9GAMM|nr:ATP-dependent helicase [Pseudoxanthomonas composti]RXQ99882.1 ATP-dependent helicase [Pseudoxanthomonas composti]
MTDPSPTLAALSAFSPATRAWFAASFEHATPVQLQAWEAISSGEHTLVIAPTGSGKTLAAFLYAIDRLFEAPTPRPAGKGVAPAAGTRVLYISPIKALAADIRRNLERPLQGVAAQRRHRGDPISEPSVAIRSGDTTPSERARLARRPPDILITTPESLFLMLTSKARDTLREVDTIIIDEIHAVAGSKRGTHLALTLERLEAGLQRPAQRIGLSATVRPPEVVARFLGGDRPVRVVSPPSRRRLDLQIVVPVEDMSDIPAHDAGGQARGTRAGSIWPHVEASILDEVLRRRSTIVFANSRGVAEKLTARLNELHAERVAQAAGLPTAQVEAQPFDSFSGATSKRVTVAPEHIARSHHGSVSKEQRAEIEQALKDGQLRCVVATSSLELGIDMGQVDLVIQVAAPPSVASALQRVGRAGHQVGGLSSGRLYPRTRRDLIDTTVAVECMLAGRIEALSPPVNPLDVLAQHTVAAVAMEPLDVEAWFARVRRAAPYRDLPRRAFEATLDMLAGRYSSDDFAGFRPRLVWNRQTNQLSARPGARQLAVTSGGTIPDRGSYRVVLPEGEERAGSRRVGELDEEMVHESRVNDVITLGATSWRIDQITHDQVVVTPAPGRSARLPFWRGEGLGRPAELGQAVGQFLETLAAEIEGDEAGMTPALQSRLAACGLDARGSANLLALVREQRQATGLVPGAQTLVAERSRDETGDWRIMLHSPYGRAVHDPWALALADRLREQWQVDPAVVASDDGIVVRLPETTGRIPGAELFVFDPKQLREQVSRCVGGSALFAARFRECASRALLLPRRQPGKRSPLWQQRLRAGQLLAIAQQYPEFPILVETARECLQDVYDLDALERLMQRIAREEVRLVEVQTQTPSPFAANLLFGYVAEFLYAGDAPAAERRASMLTLDSGLLGELLGQVDAAELLDPAVVARIAADLQCLSAERQVVGVEGVADLLRQLGPLTSEAVARRMKQGEAGSALAALREQGRAIQIVLGGTPHWAAIEDAGRLRDALGVRVPAQVPAVFLQPTPDPLGELVWRYARVHGPFTTRQLAQALGLGVAVAEAALVALAEQGRLLRGNFARLAEPEVEDAARSGHADATRAWLAQEVFQRLRVRSLQAAREAARPVPQAALVRLLLERHDLAPGQRLEGPEGVLHVVEQLAGVPLPVSAWEQQILPARVRAYAPNVLDALIGSGAVQWCGHGRLGEDDGLVSLHLRELAAESLPALDLSQLTASPLEQAIVQALEGGAGYFARQLALHVQARLGAGEAFDVERFHAALWDLLWKGVVTTDSWAPLRAFNGAHPQRARRVGRARHRAARRRVPLWEPDAAVVATLGVASFAAPTLDGRWSLLQREPLGDTERAVAMTEALLERHAIVTRGAAMSEGIVGGFPALQQVLRGMEDAGRVLRGRFVEGLGGAQFAERTTVDRLRALAGRARAGSAQAIALSAVDPANPFGAVLPWPDHPFGTRPTRRAGAFVVVDSGALVFYLGQGGRGLLNFLSPGAAGAEARLSRAAQALVQALRRGNALRFTLERIDESAVDRGPVTDALRGAGFSSAPRGLTWDG